MVGRLSLPDAPGPLDAKRPLDSPDSGLPPSPGPGPGPGPWALPAGAAPAPGPPGKEGAPPCAEDTSLSLHPPPGCALRLCPLSFGEGVEFDPLPPKDIRYTSSVKYDSEKHFINNIYMPMGLGVSSCSQTLVCVPNSTWRNYKAEVRFQPRNRAQTFTSTTIVYPKHTKTVYTTTLDYNGRKSAQRFLSSVELESSGKGPELQDC